MWVASITIRTFSMSSRLSKLNEDILPIVYQPPLSRGDSTDFGLGNFNSSFFFAISAVSNILWSVGPTLLRLPNAQLNSSSC